MSQEIFNQNRLLFGTLKLKNGAFVCFAEDHVTLVPKTSHHFIFILRISLTRPEKEYELGKKKLLEC